MKSNHRKEDQNDQQESKYKTTHEEDTYRDSYEINIYW